MDNNLVERYKIHFINGKRYYEFNMSEEEFYLNINLMVILKNCGKRNWTFLQLVDVMMIFKNQIL